MPYRIDKRIHISMEVNPRINDIFNQVINKEIQNLNNMMDVFDENAFGKIIEEVLNAPEIIVVGTRASATIAIYAEFILNRIGKRAKKIISVSVPICLINTIAISIGQLDEETSFKHLNEFEDIAKDMGFYF
ncbi:MAG: hypothetical protein QME73_02815 [Bacillota bacterium]|nr:hypothetical protein [Bacillota bacterium]